ncbi:AI-2E family transporter [Alkalibacterium kapii]|uniref:AI-2E family transporter n=1 Tax=Alkalibacterium kapii TaxID=426704 RepID=UPI001FE35837|nr:AI-2E family transporter [Alkalibacterium kapii]
MNSEDKKSQASKWYNTWFFKQIIDNKFVAALLVLFLLALNIFMIAKISYIFEPLKIAFSIVGPPIIFAVIFYYLLTPLVDWLESKRFSRNTGIAFVFSVVILVIIGGMNYIVPIIQRQVLSLIDIWPSYWDNFIGQVENLFNIGIFSNFMTQTESSSFIETITEQTSSVLNATVGGIGSFIGTVTRVIITLFTTPFVLFYLLKDGKEIPHALSRFIPTKIRPTVNKLFSDINRQISFYVRGQLIVAIFVGIMFYIGFSLIGLDFALTLGIFAGFLNLIPYLGSFIATIPALIIAVVDSPFMLFKVLIVFGVEQLLEGRVISPQVLGNSLKIHPVNIIFLLLIAGRLFGVMGVVFGIPGYAIIKIIVSMIFQWYKNYSDLYEEEDTMERPEGIIEETK